MINIYSNHISNTISSFFEFKEPWSISDFVSKMSNFANSSTTRLNKLAFKCLDVNIDGYISEVDLSETLSIGFRDVMDPNLNGFHLDTIHNGLKPSCKLFMANNS